MGFSHNLVLIIGKRLQTNLSCYCHSSIRRTHMFFLWPQGTVSLCAELSTLRGSSEDIFNETGKYYWFSYQREVWSHKWRLSAALFLAALCASKQAQLKSTAGPGCAIPKAATRPRCWLRNQPAASQPNLHLQWCWPAFPSVGMLQRQGQEQLAQQWDGMLHRRYPLTQADLSSEMEKTWTADHLGTRDPASPIFYRESIILSLIPSKQERVRDPGFPPVISRAFQPCQVTLSCGFLSPCIFPFPVFKLSWYVGLCIEEHEREFRLNSLDVFFILLLQDFRPELCFWKAVFIGPGQVYAKEVLPNLFVLTLSWICATKHSGKDNGFFISSYSNS